MGRKIFIGLPALIGLFVIAFGVSEFKMKGQLDDIDRTPVDMTQVSGGVYEGHSETELVKVDVEVDDVSGATASSEVIYDAIRKALRNG